MSSRAQNATAADPLTDLGLTAADRTALARQGFVGRERRASGSNVTDCYKLRWRSEGRQQVRCLGSDAGRAARVRDALADLQRAGRLLRQVRRALVEARRCLRRFKAVIQGSLARDGLHYHGFQVRQRKIVSATTARGDASAGHKISPPNHEIGGVP